MKEEILSQGLSLVIMGFLTFCLLGAYCFANYSRRIKIHLSHYGRNGLLELDLTQLVQANVLK